MRVEPAVVADADRLADAWVRLAREQREHGTHLLPGANREAIREDLARRIVVGEVLVARPGNGDGSDGVDPRGNDGADGTDPQENDGGENGDLLGFVSFGRDHNGFQTDVERGIVHNLYVHPEHRDRGIGAALLAAAERSLAEDGAEVVALESMAGNDDARRFYRREGYRPHRIEFEKSLAGSERGGDPGSG